MEPIANFKRMKEIKDKWLSGKVIPDLDITHDDQAVAVR